MMAATFDATIHGVGGHAAMPYNTVDPIVVTSEVMGALQTIASRNAHPLKRGGLSHPIPRRRCL